MKLVKEIKKNDFLSSNWGIYELDSIERQAFGGKFALSQGVFSDFILKEKTPYQLLSELDKYKYEGIFETRKECEMQVKLVEMKNKINKLDYSLIKVRKLMDITIEDL